MFTRNILMGNNKEKNQDPTMNSSSVYYLHPTDMGLKLITNIFTGVGFKGRKRAMSIALCGKNKMGFVDATVKRPTSTSHGKSWDRVNDIIISWIMNAVDEKYSKKHIMTENYQVWAIFLSLMVSY